MRSSIDHDIERIFRAVGWKSYAAGVLAVAVSGNAAFALSILGLAQIIGAQWLRLTITFVVGVALVVLTVFLIRRKLRSPLESMCLIERTPSPARGIVLLVSRNDAAPEIALAAIAPHVVAKTLERAWLICTAESSDHSVHVRDALEGAGVATEPADKVDDVVAPVAVFETVRSRLTAGLPRGWGADEVIVDYTGLTASASIGIVMAARLSKARIQYTPARYDMAGRPLLPEGPIEVTLDSLV